MVHSLVGFGLPFLVYALAQKMVGLLSSAAIERYDRSEHTHLGFLASGRQELEQTPTFSFPLKNGLTFISVRTSLESSNVVGNVELDYTVGFWLVRLYGRVLAS